MLIAFFAVSVHCRWMKDRKLVISTDGSWPDTPLLAEAAAFIADANGEAY
jgi:hypothetical protein